MIHELFIDLLYFSKKKYCCKYEEIPKILFTNNNRKNGKYKVNKANLLDCF